MSETKPTKGPWFLGMPAEQTSDGKVGIYGDEDGDVVVADVTSEDVSHEVCNANAALIVAAQDLLAAAKAVMKLGRELDKAGIINDPAVCALRDAISKAEGR